MTSVPAMPRSICRSFSISWNGRRTIEEEVKAGLRERDEDKKREPFERGEARGSAALGSEHEEGGGFSSFGDEYSAAEINAAERFRGGDSQLFGIPITTIAYMRRKLNVESDPTEAANEPLQIQKKKIRRDLVRLARQVAYRRNPESPNFQGSVYRVRPCHWRLYAR